MQEHNVVSDNTSKKGSHCRDVPASISLLTRPSSFRSEEDVMPDVLFMIDEEHKQICIVPNQNLAADVKLMLMDNEDVGVSSCLVDLAPCLFQPLRQQGNESLFIMLVREELFRLGLKCHAGSEVHCTTNYAT